jgi:HAD superfamily hydrolase (TIGR01484 family)
MAEALKKISLLLADVDGTLVTRDKVLTERALKAVHSLHDYGISFAITSGRPPRGMAMLIAPLAIDTPIAGFNGGLFVHPDLSIIEQKRLPLDAAKQALDLIFSHGLARSMLVTSAWFATRRRHTSTARAARFVSGQKL